MLPVSVYKNKKLTNCTVTHCPGTSLSLSLPVAQSTHTPTHIHSYINNKHFLRAGRKPGRKHVNTGRNGRNSYTDTGDGW